MKFLIKRIARYLHKRELALEIRFMLAAVYGMIELYGYVGSAKMIYTSVVSTSPELLTQLQETLSNGRH